MSAERSEPMDQSDESRTWDSDVRSVVGSNLTRTA